MWVGVHGGCYINPSSCKDRSCSCPTNLAEERPVGELIGARVHEHLHTQTGRDGALAGDVMYQTTARAGRQTGCLPPLPLPTTHSFIPSKPTCGRVTKCAPLIGGRAGRGGRRLGVSVIAASRSWRTTNSMGMSRVVSAAALLTGAVCFDGGFRRRWRQCVWRLSFHSDQIAHTRTSVGHRVGRRGRVELLLISSPPFISHGHLARGLSSRRRR